MERISPPIEQGVHTSSVTLFLIARREEKGITRNILGGIHRLVILFPISWEGDDDTSGNIARGVHTHCDIVLNIQRERK